MKIAIKRLTSSDLTFFEWHYRHAPAGKQKAINLNVNPFVSELYPALPELAALQSGRLPLDLSIYGPGGAGLHNIQRKIIKSHKNWRLNGEVVWDPEDRPDRYQPLASGDIAVFVLEGATHPTGARLILLSASITEDLAIHSALDSFLGESSMKAASTGDLVGLLAPLGVADEHPINQVYLDELVLEAACGDSEAIAKLTRGPSRSKVSPERLRIAQQQSERTGQLGEELIADYLTSVLVDGDIDNFEWVSRENAVSPFDFTIDQSPDEQRKVDVKSTTGRFENRIHVSQNELRQMAESGESYDLFRVYELDDSAGKLRIARGVGPLADTILEAFDCLPSGVTVDSVSIDPAKFDFGEEFVIVYEANSDA
jgi:hypothetical protein